MKSPDSLTHLTDAALLEELTRLASEERKATAQLVVALAEIDKRRLYLGESCPSLFTYCTRVLRLSEHAAYGRIQAARAGRRFPIILEMLAAGALTLTTVSLLAPHLTAENHVDVLGRARRRSRRDVEKLAASLRPLPDVKAMVRAQPSHRAEQTSSAAPSREVIVKVPDAPAEAPSAEESSLEPRTENRIETTGARPIVKALAPERYMVRFTISRATADKLRRVQDLMRHVVLDGDPAAIFDRALTVLLDDLEKRRLAASARPRSSKTRAPQGRHIPAAVRREVWKRDGGRCAFIGAQGRCDETGFLELHHVRPFAVGGEASVENVELRCRAHNQYEADLFFGPMIVRERRERFEADSVWTELHEAGLGAQDQLARAALD